MAEAENQEKSAETKKIKIRRMSLEQMDQALEKTAKNMGGFWSCYGKALSARREIAAASGKKSSKKS